MGKPKSGKVAEEEKMDSVNLSGLSLSEIPKPSINLALISHLDISSNNLESVPESLTARMLNLESFDVHSNHFTCLPYSIGCLSKLKLLNISGNMLDSIPMTIIYCRSLEDLNANFNKLTKLPDAIGYELHKLQKLSVNSNKLAFLPPSITHMTTLRILDARLNCLRALPEDLENLLNLQVLNVSQNFHYLTALPYAIGLLLSLVELDVSYNQITVLPSSISCLKHLEKLHVEGNPLVSPPMEVARQRPELVKAYLSDMMNNETESPTSDTSPGKKTSTWFGKLARYQTFNGRSSNDGAASPSGDMKDGLLSDFCRSFGLRPGSPRAEMGPFSPRRLFSFKNPPRS